MRRRAGRGAEEESGEKRNWRFCFAEDKAEEERIEARASVEAWEVEERLSGVVATAEPLEGDMVAGGVVYGLD